MAAAPVVDRAARDRAAQVLRDFIAGRLTNDDFTDARPSTQDPAIAAIWGTAWVLCDDMREHRLDGRHRLSPAMRRECLRWILFLDSDRPYVWPRRAFPGCDPLPEAHGGLIWRLLGLERRAIDKANVFLSAGHYRAWPFARRRDERRARANPRRLAGRSARP